jgi:YidC/Oxa1 family membrane protein insertase
VFVFSIKLFKEPGISIISISIAISFLCLPLYNVAERWQELERHIQRNLKPKADKIKSVFKGDERFMIMSAYYRKNHYHPIYAMRSTFGLLIQIPFFIAAYSYLSHLEALKDASFLFISDLGSPDAILKIGNIRFNLFPILMTLINCAAGAVYTSGLTVKEKIQLYGMAAIFLVLLYNSPSGLVLYWTINNIFSLLKNIFYKIHFKYKTRTFLFIVSIFLLFTGIYCLTHFKDNNQKQVLGLFSVFAAVILVVGIVFWKYLSNISIIAYNHKKSLLIYMLSFLVIWILFGLYIPSQLITASPQEFSFIDDYTNPVYFIFNTGLQAFGAFLLWPVCVYFLFSNNIKKYFSLAALMFCFIALCNVFLFPGKYGVISVNLVFDNGVRHTAKDIFVNLAFLIIPALFAVILYIKNLKNLSVILLSLCFVSFLGITCINFFTINRIFNNLNQYYTKEQHGDKEISPIFAFSTTGKNVVIIMLDRAISVLMPYIFEENPKLKDSYSGFSFYPNTVSFNGYTRIGALPIFGGYEATPEEINKRADVSLMEKHNQALLMLPRIFSENDFFVTVTDPPYANYKLVSDLSIYEPYKNVKALVTDSVYTDLWINEHKLHLPNQSTILKRNILWYSVFKGLPLIFRQGIYMFGNWCAPVSNHSLRLTLNGYSVLDYLPKLTEISPEKRNTALIMVNNTTHEGSLLQAPEYRPVITTTKLGTGRFKKDAAYHVNAAAVMRLAEWFDFLKKENVYDSTRIILVSDHGPELNFVTKIGLPFNVDQFNPLLMIKDFNAHGDIKTDMAFMSNADVPFFSLKDIIDNPKNPFTGKNITIDRKKEALYIAISGSMHITTGSEMLLKLDPRLDYFIHDNIFEASNWQVVSKK